MLNKYEKTHNKFLEDVKKNKRVSPLKAIRSFCLSCMGFSGKDIKDCKGGDNCPLFQFRFGSNMTSRKKKR